jgi:hydrogenase maturation factor
MHVVTLAACNEQRDVVLLIDASATQTPTAFQSLLQGVASTLDQFYLFPSNDIITADSVYDIDNSRVRISVVTFSGIARTELTLNSTLYLRNTIQSQILAIQQHTSRG